MDTQEDIIDLLNTLLEESCDAKRGYQRAAEQLDDPYLKGLFMSLSSQRDNFKKSIREETRYLGGEPTQSTSARSIQEAFSSPDLLMLLNTIEQTLAGCLRLEIERLTLYEKTLNGNDFEVSTRNLLIGQRENIKLTLADLKKTDDRAELLDA
jgi:uncharacterized protein (TIGR02284 family)